MRTSPTSPEGVPVSDVSRLLTDDHIDLLTSAAARWHVLSSATAVALSSVEASGLRATATAAGQALRQENVAALTWLTERGQSRAADRLEGVVDAVAAG